MSDDQQDPSCVSRLEPSLEPGVWRYARATRARVIVDAADYFSCMQDTMLNAERRILLIGWDFDTRIHLARGRRWWQKAWKREHPVRLGSFIAWLAHHRKRLDIRILKWSYGVLTIFARGAMWLDVLRWMSHKRISFRFDTTHPVGCSHHQKIVVLDEKVAVCGGIDMTDKRWDTREHLTDDDRRKTPDGELYCPWHDATMIMEGEIATALSELGHDRWTCAGGDPIEPVEPGESSPWPDSLDADFEDVEIGIARTRAAYREWDKVEEVRELFLLHIARAKKLIYAESQYFASRAIADAILERLHEDDPPEIVLIHPANADGWLEQQAMDHARAALVRCLNEGDTKGRFSIWCPYTDDKPIYVHAKIMVIDDEVLRIGSANLNNRSMGLDSECDVFIDAARPGNAHAADGIRAIRHSLLAEHCGLEQAEVGGLLDHHGSMAKMIEQAGKGRRRLERYIPPELNDAEETLAESQFLDPEHPDEMFEPFAKGGLFRKGSRLGRIRARIRRKRTK